MAFVSSNYTLHSGYANYNDTIDKYIREENGKIYLLESNQPQIDGCDEVLLYDFTLSEGDIVIVGDPNYMEFNLKVDSVRYITIWMIFQEKP